MRQQPRQQEAGEIARPPILPLAGGGKSGQDNARADLFTGASYAVLPAVKAPEDSVRTVVSAQDSTSIALDWVPQVAGEHHLEVVVELLGSAESRPGNNRASWIVPVRWSSLVAVDPKTPSLPLRFEFAPPRPNPARGDVSFDFAVPRASQVSLVVYDIAGRTIRRIADAPFAPGRHTLVWDRRDRNGHAVPSGMYFVRFQVPGVLLTRKTVLIR